MWQQQHRYPILKREQELEVEVKVEEQLQDQPTKPPGQEDKQQQQSTERQQDARDLCTTLKCRKTCTARGPRWTMQD